MSHFLATEDNPDGGRLEEILSKVQGDLVKRAALIVDDERPEARGVLANDVKIMAMLSDCIALAEESSAILTKSFGPSRAGKPRIGSS
jgi:hypothetical protein